jgi:alginate production protein
MSARRHLSLLSLGTALAMAPSTADAVDLDWTFKATAAGIADGGRDLGLLGRSDGQQGYLDVTPWLHVQFSDRWSALLRVRVFAPTDAVLVAGNDNNNVGATAQAYIGLKEAWVDYRGLTSCVRTTRSGGIKISTPRVGF